MLLFNDSLCSALLFSPNFLDLITCWMTSNDIFQGLSPFTPRLSLYGLIHCQYFNQYIPNLQLGFFSEPHTHLLSFLFAFSAWWFGLPLRGKPSKMKCVLSLLSPPQGGPCGSDDITTCPIFPKLPSSLTSNKSSRFCLLNVYQVCPLLSISTATYSAMLWFICLPNPYSVMSHW